MFTSQPFATLSTTQIPPRYSVIIPVFNRPDELQELLQSLSSVMKSPPERLTNAYELTEIIVVEDGSEVTSERVCRRFEKNLNIRYLQQKNAGPAAARNTGARAAKGDWLIFFDSDCVIPEGYFDAVTSALSQKGVDFYGGPDRASTDFTATQKAIDYTMTSFFTTGGIRGGERNLDRYYPRSFNMGIRKMCFEDVGGFSSLRFGEDLELSMRLHAAGFRSRLLKDAWVYHKRRTDLIKFFKQVYNSGMARVVLNQLHPHTMKPLHLLPSLFVLYLAIAILLLPSGTTVPWYPIGLLILILFMDAYRRMKNISASLRVPPAAFCQLCGYGLGLLHAWVLIHLFRRKEPRAFEKTFYK